MPTILSIWPIIKWVLQALGFMGPEDREQEREYQLRLLAAQEANREALTKAFAEFQGLWRPSAERVYVWVNSLIALFQPTLLALVYYDIIWGRKQSIAAATQLSTAGIPGLFIMSIMLFPFYGPALVQGVSVAFQSAVDLVVKNRSEPQRPSVAQRVTDAIPKPKPYVSGPAVRPSPQPESHSGRVKPIGTEANIPYERESREERQ